MIAKIIFNIFQDRSTSQLTFMESYGNTLMIFIFIIIIWYIIGIILAIWVYKDAQKRVHNENVWILIVLITGFIGFLIYILHRDAELILDKDIDEENIEDVDEIF